MDEKCQIETKQPLAQPPKRGKFMRKITQQMVEKSYEMAKEVYYKRLSKNAGAKDLNEKYGMKKYSAIIYISNIICMLNEKEYKRQMAKDHTDYFLMKIMDDFGKEYFIKALRAMRKHCDYYDRYASSNVEKLYKEIVELLKQKQGDKK